MQPHRIRDIRDVDIRTPLEQIEFDLLSQGGRDLMHADRPLEGPLHLRHRIEIFHNRLVNDLIEAERNRNRMHRQLLNRPVIDALNRAVLRRGIVNNDTMRNIISFLP